MFFQFRLSFHSYNDHRKEKKYLTMYESNFNRIEQKYLLTEDQKLNFLKKIDEYIEKDKFYSSAICNIYFDNDNRELIVHSIEKPIFKQKVRLRSYEIPTANDDVFFEIKTKYKHVVTKRRIKVKLKDFNEYLKSGVYDHGNQIMKEIDYLISYYHLKPFCFLAYDRKSYRAIENKNLRITIDANLRSRYDRLSLEAGDDGKQHFKEKTYIMEIKFLNALPIWLVKSLSDLKIYPMSFSKLGSIYKQKEE